MPEYFDFGVISERYKAQKEFNGNIIYSNLFNSIIDMFDFEGLPDSIDKTMFFRFLYSGGMCAIPLTEDKPPVCICSRGGDVNAYGYGDKIVATTQNGKSYEGIVGETIALFKNNSYMYPEFYLLQTVDLLTELYTSLKCNIINSRLAPIGKAKTDAQKAAIEKAFIDIYKGKPTTVKNADLFGDNEDIIEDFTKPENAAYIPYLSQLEDDIMQKFYYHYGLNLNNVNKRAQVSAEEIQGADPLVWTVPLQKLSELEKGFKVLRKKWSNANVKFGSVWALEYEKFKISYTQPDEQNNEDQSEEQNNEDQSEEEQENENN
jgi:hypothetical protein